MSKTLDEPQHKRPRIVASRPEDGDARDVQRVFGIMETHLYHLMRRGEIRAILVKGTGRSRGKRLFDFASIRKLLKEAKAKEV